MLRNIHTLTDMYAMPRTKPKLLIVDDQVISIQVLHQIFGTDCQVFMATNGQQALALCRQHLPDLVLLDIEMPEMDGFEVCTQLKQDESTRHIPIIFLTSHNRPEQETQGLELGAVDFITKPVNASVVRARVKTHLTIKKQSDIMSHLVFLDGLTSVYNRRYFDQQLQVEMARARRTKIPLALIILDIDYFKRYNDFCGHQGGDECLRTIAKQLRASLKRPADLLARYGGEEFVCLLPETDFDAAMLIANQLEQSVRDLKIAHENSEVSNIVTISLGVAAVSGNASVNATALLTAADAQLYLAKSSGRARVCGCEVSI